MPGHHDSPATGSKAEGELSPARFSLWLVAFLALGLYQRLLVPGPPATLTLSDSYYYGRLAWLSRLSFPHPVTFDTYVGFPGMEVQWPPGHAWLLAALQVLFGAAEPFSPDGLAALAWAGPLLNLAGIGLIIAAAARQWGRWAALVAAGALLVQPLVADLGQLGEADHHLHEAFFAAALALAIASALRPKARCLGWGLALGALAALPYLFTSSGFLFLPPVVAASLWAHLARRPGRWRRALTLSLASASCLAVVALGAWSLGRLGRGDYVRLSGFHVAGHALLLAAACAPLLWAPTRRLRLYAAVSLSAGMGIFALTASSFMGELTYALVHLGRGSAILSQAVESNPLLSGGTSGATIPLAVTLIVALPVLAAALLLAPRGPSAPPWLLPLAGWAAALAALTFAQARFARPLVGVAGVLTGLLLQRAVASGRRPFVMATRLAALLLVLPPPIALVPTSDEDSRFTQGLLPALACLKTQTADPGGRWDPTQQPEWGVLADWNLGHLVTAFALRPVVASPFGQATEAEEAAAFSRSILQMEDSAEAARLCRARSLRYALVYEPVPKPSGPRRSLRRRLASGEQVPGFRQLCQAPPADGRVARVFEIADPSL
ncbi:MAG: hypothetical protein HY901_01895 [Deltaproteobacteria bacterium]|nr:hypothetical protein [Deltaproteobacteria bacterium]